MNQFEIEEAKLVNKIIGVFNGSNKESSHAVLEMVDKIAEMAAMGVTKYAQALDWDAAATAVIELVKEKLSAKV